MDRKSTLTFYVPKNLDPEIFPEAIRDYAYYFLNLVHWKWIHWKSDSDGFVRLHYQLITKVIPRNLWPQIKNICLRSGIVESDHKTIPNKKSLGYRIARTSQVTHKVICNNPTTVQRIQKFYDSQNRIKAPIHRWLESKLLFLEFDLDQAIEIIQKLKPRKFKSLHDKKTEICKYREKRIEYAKTLNDKQHYLIPDSFGRVHTLITALERELRCCLSVNGQALINIDLANSQPLLLGIFARQYFRNKKSRYRFLNKHFTQNKSPSYCLQEIIEMTKRPICDLPKDVLNYVQLCEWGEFYQSLMKPGEVKNQFKIRFYRGVLFGKNEKQRKYPNTLWQRFQLRYPSIAAALIDLKKRNYRHSAYTLQNYESTMFIKIICGRIMQEKPDTILYTVHDSILTTLNNVNYIKTVILDEFSKLGIHPTLRTEICQ
ncbi:MAG: hypothetical protein KGL39_00015 [Patescibacteria group bacterium]|nr:hypothetical protein [Patescibacteria group bacterium]